MLVENSSFNHLLQALQVLDLKRINAILIEQRFLAGKCESQTKLPDFQKVQLKSSILEQADVIKHKN